MAPAAEDKLLREVVDFLCSHTLSVPAEALSLYRKLARLPQRYPTACVSATAVTESLRRLSTVGAINLEEVAVGSRKVLMLVGIKRNVLRSLAEEHASCGQTNTSTCADGDAQVSSAAAAAVGSLSRSAMPQSPSEAVTVVSRAMGSPPPKRDVSVAQPLVPQPERPPDCAPSAAAAATAVLDLLSRPTLLESATAQSFKRQCSVLSLCEFGTREACARERPRSAGYAPCTRQHVRRLLFPHTDVSLGDCSYLSSCRKLATCKFVHYSLDETAAGDPFSPTDLSPVVSPIKPPSRAGEGEVAAMMLGSALPHATQHPTAQRPAQWVNADVRSFDLSVLGQFAVILCDPPWNIRMSLPYGTLSDDEIRSLPLHHLQRDEGLLFLWVTGRCVELGKELLATWGYKQVEEVVWVKTNQLQSLIRSGRTGHWLNHSKEHCLVGMKGQPRLNAGIDCDVLVSEVRETSRKPDELYDLIDRLSPGSRKIEIFGRAHNIRAGWVTLGNQLPGTRLVEPQVVERYRRRYPDLADSLITH